MRGVIGIALSFLVLAAGSAAAQDLKRLQGAGDWQAYSFDEKGSPVCFMASKPKKDEGAYKARGDIYLMVTHRPAERSENVVNIVAGYDYKPDSEVKVRIDEKVFELFTHKDTAWTRTEDEDKNMVNAMIKGKKMTVQGTSTRGTATQDTYSLIGFTKTYKSISQACK